MFCKKAVLKKFGKTHRKICLLESLFKKVSFTKFFSTVPFYEISTNEAALTFTGILDPPLNFFLYISITLFMYSCQSWHYYVFLSPNFNITEAAIQRCSYKKVFWKYTANLLESTHAEVWFQAILLKSHFSMGILL